MKYRYSLCMYLIMLILFTVTSCLSPLEKGVIDIKIKSQIKSEAKIVNPIISSVTLVGDQIILDGSNFNNLNSVKLNAQNLSVISNTGSKLILSAASAMTLALGSVLNLVIETAHGAATVPVIFNLVDGSITASKIGDGEIGINHLSQMGAGVGQVMQWNGTTWIASDLSGLIYLGAWDASLSGTGPDLGAGTVAGEYYVVSNPGTVNVDGTSTWAAGDWVVWNGATWDKIDNSTGVTTFNGRAGTVTSQSGDYNLSHLGDVDVTGIAANKILKYDGTKWIIADDLSSGGAGSVSSAEIQDGSITASDLNAGLNTTLSQVGTNASDIATNASDIASSALDISDNASDIAANASNIATNTSNISTNATAIAGKENSITAGTTAQYWRGDKSWQTLDKASVALSNVDNIQQMPLSYLDTSTTLAADSDSKVASQKAVKAYIDTQVLSAGSGDLKSDGSVAMSADFNLGNNKVKFKSDNANFVELKAPDSLAATYSLIFPADDGTLNQVLTTNGSGVLSWTTPSVGTGDITDVVAGTGLTGGATTGSATLNVDVGTTAGKIVQLDGAAKLPTSVETDPTVSAFAKVVLPTCGVGEVLKSNGTALSCVTDIDTNTDTDTTYTAGSGLDLTGTTFSIPAEAIVDTKLAGLSASCANGEILRTNGLGSFYCFDPLDLGDGFFASFGVGASPDASAALDVSSTTKGFLPPRMTETERDAILSPATGLVIYNKDSNYLNIFNGTSWTTNGEASLVGFKAILGSNVAISTTAVNVKFDTEIYDDGNIHDPVTGRFNVTEAGYYILSSFVSASSLTGPASVYQISILKNGVSIIRENEVNSSGYSSIIKSIATIDKAIVGDYYELNMYVSDTSGGNELLAGSSFSASKLSAGGISSGGALSLDSIDSTHIQNNAVTTSEIADGTITSTDIASNTITVANVDFASTDGINIPQLAANPVGGIAGQTYFNTTTNKMMYFDGASWIDFSTSSGGVGSAFKAYKLGTEQTLTSTEAIIDYTNESFDLNNEFDTATNRFTPKSAGYYFIYMNLTATVPNGGGLYGRIYMNGVIQSTAKQSQAASSALSVNASNIVYMNGTTDYIDARALCSTNCDAFNSEAGNYIIGYKLNTGAGASTDNLGNHAATQNLDLANYKLVGGGGSAGIAIDNAGNVGIGVTSPVAKLDVAGEVKFGNTASTCNGTNEGQQRYNSTSKVMEFCNGTSWLSMVSGSGQLGVGQTWQNLTVSRAFGTNYTNSTGKPIQVSAYGVVTGYCGISGIVDGVTVATQWSGAASYTQYSNVAFIVPAGSVYSISNLSGTCTLSNWAELR